MKRFAAGLVLLVALAASAPAAAQCALCYESAAQAGKKGQNAISKAILVLLIPPAGMIATLFGLALNYKGRNERDLSSDDHDIRL